MHDQLLSITTSCVSHFAATTASLHSPLTFRAPPQRSFLPEFYQLLFGNKTSLCEGSESGCVADPAAL